MKRFFGDGKNVFRCSPDGPVMSENIDKTEDGMSIG